MTGQFPRQGCACEGRLGRSFERDGVFKQQTSPSITAALSGSQFATNCFYAQKSESEKRQRRTGLRNPGNAVFRGICRRECSTSKQQEGRRDQAASKFIH